MAARIFLALAILLSGLPLMSAHAQDDLRKPTTKEVTAIRNCATKYKDEEEAVSEQHCLFKLVAEPCTNSTEGSSNRGAANCYRIEAAIWDALLNENFKDLLAVLDDNQVTKLRAMQKAWIAYRDTTCNFYWDKIQGTMAVPMHAACYARETARRAMLLKAFSEM